MTDREEDDDRRTAHPSVPPGSSFGKYEVIRRLGEGGMGSVYEARHGDLGRRVALKVLRSKLARNKTYLERFLREGRIAARLDHPHVVGVFDVGTEAGSPFLVMEFLSGEDLDGYLSGRGPLEASEAVDLLLPILSALDTAHAAGLVHRDLKPANIFLCRAAHGGFHPKLLDFGIAKPGTEEAAQLTGTAEVFGTPQYMAPEQVRRAKDAKAESDQYAMGVILYRAVVGKEAFEMGDLSVYAVLERVVGGTFPSPRRVRPDVDMGIERVILRAMSKDPKDRFASVRALGAALLPYASPPVRKTWTEAFSSEAANAATIPPPDTSSLASSASSASTPTAMPSAPVVASSAPLAERSAPPGTLAAAEVATRGSLHRESVAPPAPKRPRVLGAIGVAIGLAACAAVYLLTSRDGTAAGPAPATPLASAEPRGGKPEPGGPIARASTDAPAIVPSPTTTATEAPSTPPSASAAAPPTSIPTAPALPLPKPPTPTPSARPSAPPPAVSAKPPGTYPIE